MKASSSSTTLPLPSIVALSALLLQPVAAEVWNPRVHINPRRSYVAPRTSDPTPRPLRRRAPGSTLKPGQPTHTVSDDFILGFEVIGETGVSAQQLFLGSDTKVSPSLDAGYLRHSSSDYPFVRFMLLIK